MSIKTLFVSDRGAKGLVLNGNRVAKGAHCLTRDQGITTAICVLTPKDVLLTRTSTLIKRLDDDLVKFERNPLASQADLKELSGNESQIRFLYAKLQSAITQSDIDAISKELTQLDDQVEKHLTTLEHIVAGGTTSHGVPTKPPTLAPTTPPTGGPTPPLPTRRPIINCEANSNLFARTAALEVRINEKIKELTAAGKTEQAKSLKAKQDRLNIMVKSLSDKVIENNNVVQQANNMEANIEKELVVALGVGLGADTIFTVKLNTTLVVRTVDKPFTRLALIRHHTYDCHYSNYDQDNECCVQFTGEYGVCAQTHPEGDYCGNP
ncbi:unnamed protein product, partial [Oppiella nova]